MPRLAQAGRLCHQACHAAFFAYRSRRGLPSDRGEHLPDLLEAVAHQERRVAAAALRPEDEVARLRLEPRVAARAELRDPAGSRRSRSRAPLPTTPACRCSAPRRGSPCPARGDVTSSMTVCGWNSRLPSQRVASEFAFAARRSRSLNGSFGSRGSGWPRGPRVSQNTHVAGCSSASAARRQIVVAAE